MNDKYISLELAKKLADAGCELESDKVYRESSQMWNNKYFLRDTFEQGVDTNYEIRAYDIIWDICVRYKDEFFGRGKKGYDAEFQTRAIAILGFLQNGEDVNDYIWSNSLFNPKNK